MSLPTPPSPKSTSSVHHDPCNLDPYIAPSNPNSDEVEAFYLQDEERRAEAVSGKSFTHGLTAAPSAKPVSCIPNAEMSATTPLHKLAHGIGNKPTLLTTTPLSSSPVLYPQSSSPPFVATKRRLAPTREENEPKKRKTRGPFLVDEDSEDSETDEPTVYDKPEIATDVTWKTASEAQEGRGEPKPAVADKPQLPALARADALGPGPEMYPVPIRTCSGKTVYVRLRPKTTPISYQETIAQRSASAGKAKTSYYGIDIHKLIDEHKSSIVGQAATATDHAKKAEQSIEVSAAEPQGNGRYKHQMWTEKYRARKFTDLIGDERTHRSVLRWLKAWDPVVFPGTAKKQVKKQSFGKSPFPDAEYQHRKILLLTGPPGLGKTTLAHVCARQAGYETLEINASDDRSREVVKGRIRDAVGTENVRGVDVCKGGKKTRKAGKPVCVVVDEVDGVVSGTGGGGGGGEGGFMKALIDLIQLDQKNSQGTESAYSKSKKGDRFRLMRPLILVCNDLYAPALRLLRTSSCAEIIHVKKPPLEKTISRLGSIFEKEGIRSDKDAVRRLCEASWGIGSFKQAAGSGGGNGEGDIRGVLVQGEWAAHKLRSSPNFGAASRLSKDWIEQNILNSGSHASSGLGRNGVREIVERVFTEGAGLLHLPKKLPADELRQQADPGSSKQVPWGVADLRKRAAIDSIREMADTLSDHDRLMTECFSAYPTKVFQDDTFLTKPVKSYDWLHFHDMLSSRVFAAQDWELKSYLSQSTCAFHHLFAAVNKEKMGWDMENAATMAEKDADSQVNPFVGPRADYAAYEAEKATRAVLTEFQSGLTPTLTRLYRSVNDVATELVPNATRMLAPNVKPVVLGGSGGQNNMASVRKQTEKDCVKIASRVMVGLGTRFEKVRVEIEGGGAHSHGGFALRMEPPLDSLATFESLKASAGGAPAPVRYAVRQAVDQEHRQELLRLQSESRRSRGGLGQQGRLGSMTSATTYDEEDKENSVTGKGKGAKIAVPMGKRDFFGRIVNDVRPTSAGKEETGCNGQSDSGRKGCEERRVWVSYHEGFSNAVRKPISLKEFLDSF